jgi:low affinity Fe/Cu permease
MFEKKFTRIANGVAYFSGLPAIFIVCVALVAVWGISGPVFGFSDTWQLVINTSTTIITFLMVFLIQNTQNRDGAAVQAKLDELIRVSKAGNHFIGIEHLTESEVEEIRNKCEQAAKRHDAGAALKESKQDISNDVASKVIGKVVGKTADGRTKRAAKPKAAASRRSPAKRKNAVD